MVDWFYVTCFAGLATAIAGSVIIAINLPLENQWYSDHNSKINSLLDSVARFDHDHELSVSERIDIMKGQHLINANQLAQYQLLADQYNPYTGNSLSGVMMVIFGGLIFGLFGIFVFADIKDRYDSAKSRREMYGK